MIALVSCSKETNAPDTSLNENVDTASVVVAAGMFENGPFGMVTGSGKIFRNHANMYSVVLDSFMTSNGPDLYVYLSQEKMPVNFIEAGKLKAVAGRQVYELSSMPDLSSYRYVCIHCKAYNHLFGFAELK